MMSENELWEAPQPTCLPPGTAANHAAPFSIRSLEGHGWGQGK